MDDEDGKGAAAAAAARPAESTGAYSLDVNVDAGADVEAEASTRHDGRTGTRTTAAAEPSSSTSTSTSSSANATTVAAGEAELDGDNDAGTKMDHNLHNPFLHGHDYGHGGASRRPLPMSLPARSSNSFTPINDFVHQDDHYATLPPLGPSALPTMNAMNCPQPQPLPPRQRTSLPTARPSSSATTNAPAAYYPGHTDGRLLPTNYGIQPGEMAQYALLPPEPKQFQRQLAKKEIKRRTKTGCMTCRKRRIKCDEARPSCNNCKKSKRECLGYDPVFREQSIPGHTNTRSSPVPSSPSSRDPTTPNYHHEPSQETRHETPAASEATARGLPTAAPFIPADAPPGTHEWWRTVIANLHYPFVPAADDNRDPVQGHSTRIKSEPTEPSRSGTFFDPITGAASESREACARNDSQSNGLPSQNSGGKPFRVPGVMRVADLINGFGTNAPAPEPVQTDEAHQEVTKVYHEIYANGLSAFFESTWFFFTDDGKMTFPRTGNTAGHVAAFLKLMNGVEVYHHAFMAHCSGVELRLVWELSKLASTAAPDKADNRMRVTLPPEDDAIEVKNRFSVVDALLGGDFLPWNPLTPSVEDGNPHRVREFDFWYQLGDYLRWNADQDPAGEETRRQEAIDRMRWLLDGRENRDVLYSIVLLRHYATRFDLGEVVKAKYHLPEAEAQNRVVVASKFITHQAEVAGGTTNVIRRISDIAKRRYVEPANITQGDQQPQQ